MNTTITQLMEEFQTKFGHIANKGVQCDQVTIDNLIHWLTEVYTKRLLEEVRAKLQARMMKYDSKDGYSTLYDEVLEHLSNEVDSLLDDLISKSEEK